MSLALPPLQVVRKNREHDGQLLFRAAEHVVDQGSTAWAHVAACDALHPAPNANTYLLAKRFADFVVAGIALALLLPALLLIGLAIKLDSPGSILYRHHRIGRDGKRFAMFKFRTMRRDRRVRSQAVGFPDRRMSLKAHWDPRVTRVGRFLRRTSLDEVPQLINVLRGDMSLVGPRPEQVEMLNYYRAEHYRRHLATPGLTGWWQINGRITRPRNCAPHDDLHQKLADDSYYLEHRSFLFDLRVLLLTVPVVLMGKGAV